MSNGPMVTRLKGTIEDRRRRKYDFTLKIRSDLMNVPDETHASSHRFVEKSRCIAWSLMSDSERRYASIIFPMGVVLSFRLSQHSQRQYIRTKKKVHSSRS